jgi:ketosteroid isomerase-like protein
MRFRGVRLAGIAATSLLAAPISAHQRAAAEAQEATLAQSARGPAAIVDAFHSALRRGDTAAAAAMLANDALIFEEGGAERSKAEYVAKHLPADAAFSKAVRSQVTRRAGHSDGTLAWIATEGRISGAFKGKPVERTTTETMVLRRMGSTWRIVHIHWSSAAAH